MAPTVELRATRCATCGTEGKATQLWLANFELGSFTPAVFSARRLPDRIHYRMVKCDACGLVRSDPAADSAMLAQLYAQSTFDYSDEVPNLRRTYGRCLARVASCSGPKGALLEIGCGNGFFLEEALAQGYTTVRGIEPSTAALAGAAPQVQPHIVCDVMRPGLLEPKQFDVICMFQVFDHISEPGALLDECLRVLKPGGRLLCLTHNIESLSARLLGERSPIVDIEHTYLYGPRTISLLLTAHGFGVERVSAVRNTYSLRYLARLVPLPLAIKRPMLALLASSQLGRIPLAVALGNLCAIACRP